MLGLNPGDRPHVIKPPQLSVCVSVCIVSSLGTLHLAHFFSRHVPPNDAANATRAHYSHTLPHYASTCYQRLRAHEF